MENRNDIKLAIRQRLQYIEIMVYYTGVVTRRNVAQAFGISDPAATKVLKLYSDLAPGNVTYKQTVFGFVPMSSFKEVFADLTPATILPMIGANLIIDGILKQGEGGFRIPVDSLVLPKPLPDKAIVSQITRAIHHHKKLSAAYHSLSNKTNNNRKRVIEPHSLFHAGLRWYVRAYNEDTFDFRDFALSRFEMAGSLNDDAESRIVYDDDWVEIITLKLAPHPRLNEKNQASLLLDYGSDNGIIEVQVRRALIAYLLQQLSVDPTKAHSLNPKKYQLIILNRDEIEPFASWAFNEEPL